MLTLASRALGKPKTRSKLISNFWRQPNDGLLSPIFKNQQTGSATIRELLQSMFIGEMLETGDRIWIVSPWVSNIVLIDNRSGNFDSLSPEWGRREVRLADVLIGFMARGTSCSRHPGSRNQHALPKSLAGGRRDACRRRPVNRAA